MVRHKDMETIVAPTSLRIMLIFKPPSSGFNENANLSMLNWNIETCNSWSIILKSRKLSWIQPHPNRTINNKRLSFFSGRRRRMHMVQPTILLHRRYQVFFFGGSVGSVKIRCLKFGWSILNDVFATSQFMFLFRMIMNLRCLKWNETTSVSSQNGGLGAIVQFDVLLLSFDCVKSDHFQTVDKKLSVDQFPAGHAIPKHLSFRHRLSTARGTWGGTCPSSASPLRTGTGHEVRTHFEAFKNGKIVMFFPARAISCDIYIYILNIN